MATKLTLLLRKLQMTNLDHQLGQEPVCPQLYTSESFDSPASLQSSGIPYHLKSHQIQGK